MLRGEVGYSPLKVLKHPFGEREKGELQHFQTGKASYAVP